MKYKVLPLAILFICAFANVGFSGTTTWVGNGDASNWSDPLNWSGGVPTATTVASLPFPAGDTYDININSNTSVQGLIFGADLTYDTQLLSGSGVTLTLGASGLTNNSTKYQIFTEAAMALGTSCTFSAGPLGFVQDKSLNIQTNTLTVATGASTLILQGGTLLGVSSPSIYGKIAGTGPVEVSGALTFDFTSAVGPGTWDFINQTPTSPLALTSVSLTDSYSGAFTESTPGSWDATAGGLSWNYKASTGVLTAVPEPSTWVMLVGGLGSLLAFRRRR